MIKVAVLDDYQNVFEQIINIDLYKDKFEFKIFNEAFKKEEEATKNVTKDTTTENAKEEKTTSEKK